jgi:hypothetical protein
MSEVLKFESQIDVSNLEKLNDEFSKAECKVMYVGANRNMSYITKESVENALGTIYNIPVIAEVLYKEGEDKDFGTHGGRLVIDSNGARIEQTTVPYGVVPESCNPRWVEEGDKEYLVCDVFLWTGRYDDLEILLNDEEKQRPQSMEIMIGSSYIDDDEYEVIEDFSFSALTILGADVEPCFEDARVKMYERDIFKEEYEKLFNLYNKINKEGGENLVDDNKKFVSEEDLMSEPPLKVDKSKDALSMNEWGDVDKSELVKNVMKAENFKSIADDVYMLLEEGWEEGTEGACKYPVMELKEDTLVYNRYGLASALAYAKGEDETSVVSKVEEIMDKLDINEEEEEDGENMTKENEGNFELSYKDKMDILYGELEKEGSYVWIFDFTDTKVDYEIDSYSEENGYEQKMYRAPYELNVETKEVTIDFENQEELFVEIITKAEKEEIESNRKMALDNLKEEIKELKADLDEHTKENEKLQSELDKEKQFRLDFEEAKRKEKIDGLIDSFEEVLGDEPEFSAIKDKAYEMKYDEIENACYILIGKANFSKKKSKKDDKKAYTSLNLDNKDFDKENIADKIEQEYKNKFKK